MLSENALRLDQRLDDWPVDAVGRIASVYADPQAANSVADGFEIIRDVASRVVGSFLSVPAITQRMAAASATDRVIGPTWVQRVGERENAVSAHPAPGRLYAGKTAGSRRKPD